eukprot:CAMPEP_0203902480 /NCGR_PEP_ID=MMETSP0359-20131031/44557_1 /ASSEMBLY_ACC=CAM_ASM_000338 /TAXON_ID=268821 /ORGANISM="Scrippsiella Hangoei, Strain SHTV-5" /LENGTH=50 /DNA_ID=CAMNT_0050826345 /DNA_START=35 /DNA_END=184 /DNA_ORIENTATION=+
MIRTATSVHGYGQAQRGLQLGATARPRAMTAQRQGNLLKRVALTQPIALN